MFMYKHHHGWLPSALNIFTKNVEKYDYDSRIAGYVEVPMFHTEFGQKSIKYQAVKFWNKIFKFIKVDIKIGTFKKYLKSFLIKQ